jgi:hypothetical protein
LPEGAEHAIADFGAGDPVADRDDLSHSVRSRHQRQWKLERIGAGDHVGVAVIERDRTHADHDLAAARLWFGPIH